MPDIDLEPGDYTERKPKGWRWKMPWSHPEDTKLPMVGFFVMVAAIAFMFINRSFISTDTLFGGAAMAGAVAGGCLVLWLRD